MRRVDLLMSIPEASRLSPRRYLAARGVLLAAALVLIAGLLLVAVLVACGGTPAAVDSPGAGAGPSSAAASGPPAASAKASPVSGGVTAAGLRRLFPHEDAEPLGLKVAGGRTVDGVAVRDVTYEGSGARVTGVLSVPAGDGPYPAVLYAPGVGCPAAMFESDMAALQRAGVAALAVDPPDGRAPFAEPVSLDPETVAAAHIQYVGDLRRGLDVLASLPEVDPERLGYVGYSWGGYVGGFLAGLRAPTTAYVLTYAGADWVTADPTLGGGGDFVDPAAAVRLSRAAAFLFQAGADDPLFSRVSVRRYYQSAPGPKALQWFPGGHGDLWAQPSGAAVESHRDWLKTNL